MLSKIVVAYGTRPELIKLAPLILKLREEAIDLTVISTGQHKEMLEQLEKLFGINPDVSFRLMESNQSLNGLMSKVINRFDAFLEEKKPDLVIVQGDTSTVLSVAMAAYNRKIKVAHIEAGLRTYDLNHPFPEEFNRRVVSIFADYNFAPTEQSAINLRKEGVDEKKIQVVGNTVIDAIKIIEGRIAYKKEGDKKIILVTAHRRENHNSGIKNICDAIKSLLRKRRDLHFVWPVHPNPNVKPVVEKELKDLDDVSLLEPIDYLELLSWIKSSQIVLTDSGGIQEECPSFRKPVLILRDTTERPEVIKAGFGILVGTDPAIIAKQLNAILDSETIYNQMVSGDNPFGDGHSSNRIIETIINGN